MPMNTEKKNMKADWIGFYLLSFTLSLFLL